MANRSDFNSVLPRSIKRMLILGGSDPEKRRMFIEAHAHHKRARNAMLSARTNVDSSSVEPEETPKV